MYQFNIYVAYNHDDFHLFADADILAHEHFPDGWTRLHTTGGWHGLTEPGFVYQMLLDSHSDRPWSVMVFANSLCILFNQQAVLVTRQPIESYLITELIQ